MDRWRGKVALVTGASAGIGAAICRELVHHGMTVVGCARNHKRIEELAAELKGSSGSLTAMHCDLTKSDEIEAMFCAITKQFGGVDVCINNAGLNFTGGLLDGAIDKWRTILDVNVLALAHCAQLAIKGMKDRDVTEGQVINICSQAGHMVGPYPNSHFYTATKFAVTALTEGLRQELAADETNKIRVAQLSPGLVKTEIVGRMLNDMARGDVIMAGGMDASAIAKTVTFVMSLPPDVQVHDVLMRPTSQKR
ncbi:dehydrogenase/reductase SDR family member 11-like [Pollicipes pollicipes]|uniref:dehydrogenase/reductase SDR family member 11-like n=1 Tax=Pollicipes pollicipes TaxID=41117 RepID=UPI0018854894|nr:dehydrogenase/reductase SDR family member 11-like [Pollicipes pollicipes]XP_037069477.1 dehydrogenase/reductase SDR family member 11-like [Pollicipes pollicipes]